MEVTNPKNTDVPRHGSSADRSSSEEEEYTSGAGDRGRKSWSSVHSAHFSHERSSSVGSKRGDVKRAAGPNSACSSPLSSRTPSGTPGFFGFTSSLGGAYSSDGSRRTSVRSAPILKFQESIIAVKGAINHAGGALSTKIAKSNRSSWASACPTGDCTAHRVASEEAPEVHAQQAKPVWTKVVMKTERFDDVITNTKREKEDQLRADARFLIMPGSTGLTYWRIMMTFAVLWACTVAPLELAFSWWEPSPVFKAISYLVDTMCVTDMVLNFFIASIKKGRLVTKKRKIAFAYLKTWFAIDLLTNIPWDLLLQETGKSRKVVKVVKLPKVLRLCRLLRVAREEAHTLGIFFTLFGLCLLVHYISCMWAVLLIDCPEEYIALESETLCPGIAAAYAEGLAVGMSTLGGSDSWLRFMVESGRSPGQSISGHPTGFIWKSPGVEVEISAAVTCLLGVCAVGILFANIARAMDKKDAHTRKFNERLYNVKEAFLQHEMSKDIYNRARKHFHYVWSCGTDASRSLLEDKTLSLDLRRELAYSFYGDMLRKVPFFEAAEDILLKQICRYARMEVFSPEDNILLAGENAGQLCFLVAGCVNVMNRQGAWLRCLEEGSFFGEMSLFFEDYSHQVNVVGASFGCVLTVDREIVQDLCSEDLLESFRTVALERNESILEDWSSTDQLRSMTLTKVPGKHGMQINMLDTERLTRTLDSARLSNLKEEDCESDKSNRSWMRVYLESARALQQAYQGAGSPDVYCICELEGSGKCVKQHATKVAHKTLHPCWHETFEIENFLATDTLSFRVYDKDGCEEHTRERPHHFLGAVEIGSEIFLPGGWNGELELKDHSANDFVSRGWLKLKIDVNTKVSSDGDVGTHDLHPTTSSVANEAILHTQVSQHDPPASLSPKRGSGVPLEASCIRTQGRSSIKSTSSSSDGIAARVGTLLSVAEGGDSPRQARGTARTSVFSTVSSLESVVSTGSPTRRPSMLGAGLLLGGKRPTISSRRSSNSTSHSMCSSASALMRPLGPLSLVEVRLEAKMEYWSGIIIHALGQYEAARKSPPAQPSEGSREVDEVHKDQAALSPKLWFDQPTDVPSTNDGSLAHSSTLSLLLTDVHHSANMYQEDPDLPGVIMK